MTESALAGLMAQVSIQMKADLASSRVALSHKLSGGEALEEAVRIFLREHLPQSVGVTTGQVIDSAGSISRQVDVIVYDAGITPIFYRSKEGGHQLVPSEGVIAVVEVKTTLRTSEIEDIFANMESVKNLDKSAYYPTESPVINEVKAYGEKFRICPTLYYVFAFETEGLNNATARIRKLNEGRPLSRRVDLVCVLDSGVIFYQNPTTKQISGLPAPVMAEMAGHSPDHALLLFYILIAPYLFQIRFGAIDMLRYLPSDFDFMPKKVEGA